jgi:hypothetical protein
MFPSLPACLHIADIDVVENSRPVYVNVHIMVSPVETAPRTYRRSYEKTNPKCNTYPDSDSRIPHIGWISRVPPWTINHRRIIRRHIYDLGIGRLDLDVPLLDYHLLLLCCIQVALSLSLIAKFLYSIHYILLLI